MPREGRRFAGEVDADWGTWIPIGACAIPVAVVVGAVVQRHALFPPRLPALWALILVVPFVTDALASLHVVSDRFRFPPLLFSAVVIGASVPLSFVRPLNSDIAPFALVMLVGEMASRLELRRSIAITAIPAVLCTELVIRYRAPGFGIWILAFGFAWLAGTWMRVQTMLATQLREAQSGLAEKAAADERSRIAREVHDVIAHSMSVTMLHITAARMALEKRQSDSALDSLREAEKQGRNSLNDIRRTVGLLGGDGGAPPEPMPSVTDLARLVGDFRGAGLDVDLDISGDITSIAPAAGLNIYRIAQESLTNVAKYAHGSHTRLELSVGDDEIRMRVTNTAGNGHRGRPSGNGLGVRGMVERATLLGGSLHAGPDGGGWTVSLTAPRTLAPA
jgi:signal transduction histidine kinase